MNTKDRRALRRSLYKAVIENAAYQLLGSRDDAVTSWVDPKTGRSWEGFDVKKERERAFLIVLHGLYAPDFLQSGWWPFDDDAAVAKAAKRGRKILEAMP